MIISRKRYEREKGDSDRLVGILREELRAARDFKHLIERLSDVKTFSMQLGTVSIGGSYDPLSSETITFNVRGHVATLVPDELTENNVIVQQMATPVLILNKDGSVKKRGFTAQKADKGYSYKLIRE